ncbi:MAG: DUF1559 domain-containing protein [Gemmataceae bacterium]
MPTTLTTRYRYPKLALAAEPKGAHETTTPRFTLIELLVAMAVIAVLLGLLLAAIQRVRESASRLRCANNLKQIGLALQNYHAARGTFPPGIVTGKSAGEPYAGMTWLVRLLPHLEQESLWNATVAAYRQSLNPYRDPPHVGLATPMALFSCPSDGRAEFAQDTHDDYRVALTNYLGVNGTEGEARDGVLLPDRTVPLTEVTDGTSNTLAVGERPPSPDFWYGWWYSGAGHRGDGVADYLLGVRERNFGGRFVW